MKYFLFLCGSSLLLIIFSVPKILCETYNVIWSTHCCLSEWWCLWLSSLTSWVESQSHSGLGVSAIQTGERQVHLSDPSSVSLVWVDCGQNTAISHKFLVITAIFHVHHWRNHSRRLFQYCDSIYRDKTCPKLSGGFLLFCFVFCAIGSVNSRQTEPNNLIFLPLFGLRRCPHIH